MKNENENKTTQDAEEHGPSHGEDNFHYGNDCCHEHNAHDEKNNSHQNNDCCHEHDVYEDDSDSHNNHDNSCRYEDAGEAAPHSLQSKKNSRESFHIHSFLRESLQKALNEKKDLQDKYLRSLAENENMRKRFRQEKEMAVAFSLENAIKEMLVPLDHLENALCITNAENTSPELRNWAQGFSMILQQFKSILNNYEIYPYESIGQKFNPNLHDGVEIIETDDYEDGTIVSECLKGYKKGDRIVRVAKVKIAKRPIKSTKEDHDNE